MQFLIIYFPFWRFPLYQCWLIENWQMTFLVLSINSHFINFYITNISITTNCTKTVQFRVEGWQTEDLSDCPYFSHYTRNMTTGYIIYVSVWCTLQNICTHNVSRIFNCIHVDIILTLHCSLYTQLMVAYGAEHCSLVYTANGCICCRTLQSCIHS